MHETQENQPPGTLFRNAKLFDGVHGALQVGMTVLVAGNRIKRITCETPPVPDGFHEIDCRGHVLMPGLINSHYHMAGALPISLFYSASPKDYRVFRYARALEMTLMQGVTTVRDVGGNDWGVVRAAEEGLIPAPRIFASGALISQTGGHFDFRPGNMTPERSEHAGDLIVVSDGMALLADGPDAVRRAARECLRQGATQIKIASSGGVASLSDPIHSIQFSPEEVRAAVQAARDWDTYVATHVYTAEAAIRAIGNGVMSLEHANLMTEEAVKLGVEHGVWWSPQTMIYLHPSEELNAAQKVKLKVVVEGMENTFALFQKHDAKVLFGTDCIGNMAVQHLEFTYRSRFFSSLEILRQATANGGQALRMSGRLYPCPGDLGVIREGAMADILVVKDNPLEDVTILSDYEAQLLLIMKDGGIYKDILP
uniref:Imidazolonepropionase n=1 Tax=Candidatus Kentrum eta TaxID=2126337 RepID=A0A450UF18_9GAMM|nr:MAG: Imidazolonepropionase [Candidatus Kentron sp. H]VFJ91140.1 MAG: Imidazolonepropionase [Candidatus Kentron sp. H]VFJ97455.1 MAG: Imidazolonepropionase [Candidatus Kentron sp. H]